MSDGLPGSPMGNDRFTLWARQLRDYVKSLKIRPSADIDVSTTSEGTTLRLKSKIPGKGGGSGGMNYRGTYDPTVTYNQFDVVRKQTGTSQGVWISVATIPMTGVDPVWPEVSGQWELITFGVQASSACSNGTKTIYLNALPPS